MEAVIECPPLAGGLFDMEMMRRSIKLQKVGFGRAATADVINLLKQNGIRPEDIETFSSGEDGTSVTFKDADKLRLVSNLNIQGKQFRVTEFGKQTLAIKIHWLPVFVGEPCIKAMLASYGKVIKVERLKSQLGGLSVYNGQWFVSLEVDEVEKNNLPHLFKFACGSRALLTVRGRPPICLRCLKVGHVRNSCPGWESRSHSYHAINRSFAEVISGTGYPQPTTDEDRPEMDDELQRIMETRTKDREGHLPEPSPNETTETPPGTSVDVDLTGEMSEGKEEEEEESEEESEGEGMMEGGETGAGVRGAKRPSDEQDYAPSSFDENFPPNRPAKKASRKAGGSARSGVEEVLMNNSFSLLAEFAESPAGGDM
jgi:hypothetical protein